jgi:hypothetical protein
MIQSIWTIRERKLNAVPQVVKVLLVLAFFSQLILHALEPAPGAVAKALELPADTNQYRLLSLDDPLTMSRLMMLWLQAFDNQPGISISFHELNYFSVQAWLDQVLLLDPGNPYPLMAASRVYGSINNPEKQRLMLDYVYDKFQEDPEGRWRWLAHASIVAKHQLNDLPLALKYADTLAEKLQNKNVPFWAKDMRLTLREDMGQYEAAAILIGGLLESGQIKDETELRFLQQKLEEINTIK